MISMPKRLDDPIPPERYRHDELVSEETMDAHGRRSLAKRVVTQTPLDRYYRRQQITQRQWQAGNELWTDWYNGGLEPSLVMDLDRVRVDQSTGNRASYRRAEHRERFHKALKAVGPIASNEVVQVVCQQIPAGSRMSMEILRRGLDVLADWYGY